jgi:hypothetical protein
MLAAFSAAFVLETVAWPDIVAPAWHVAHGFRLYDCVISFYTPALILVTAGLGRLAGFGPVLFRALAALPLALCALLVVRSARGPRERWTRALLGPPLLILWSVYLEGPALAPDSFLAPLLLAAGLSLRRFERTGSERGLDLAGFLLGAAILVKQTSAWALLAGVIWCLVSSRRRSRRRAARLLVAGSAPYAAFVLLWGLVAGTTAPLRWTLLIPLRGRASEIGQLADLPSLIEAIAPALAIPATWFLARALAAGRSGTSPLAWLSAGAALMTVPRWGLLHLSGAVGLVVVLSIDGLRALRAVLSRRFLRATRGSLAFAAGGTGLLLIHLGVAAFGAGPFLLDAWGRGVRYWDDPRMTALTREVSRRVPPGGEFLNYFATWDSIYPATGTVAPGGLYVNTSLWFFLNKDDLDRRVVEALRRRPDTLILFAEPQGEGAAAARKTRLYGFLAEETGVLARVDDRICWRAVRGSSR